MKLLATLLLAVASFSQAHAATIDCSTIDPAKGILAYPILMDSHAAFKDYEIRVFDSLDCDKPLFKDPSALEILKDGKRIYTQTGWSFAIGYPVEGDQSPDSVKAVVGMDITGEGIPDILISEWSGHAHCCLTFHIFQLGDSFKKIQSVPLFDADESSFVTRPDIKGMLINSSDFSDFAYFPSDFAESPAGHVLLSIQDGNFHLNQEYMKSNPAKPEEISKCADLFRQSRSWKDPVEQQPSGMWYYATDLIYTGNAVQAWSFLDAAWGGGAADKQEYLADYQQRLKKSVYYQDLMLLQKAPISAQGQKIDWLKQCFEYMHG